MAMRYLPTLPFSNITQLIIIRFNSLGIY
jgi:hypothetical protein